VFLNPEDKQLPIPKSNMKGKLEKEDSENGDDMYQKFLDEVCY
jgi:hypothetical protein